MALRLFAKEALTGVGAGVVRVDSCTDSRGLLTYSGGKGQFFLPETDTSYYYRSGRGNKNKAKLKDASTHRVKSATVNDALQVAANPNHL